MNVWAIIEKYQARKTLKNMSLKYHFIRNEIKLKKIKLEYVKTTMNLADFLTKPVGRTSITRALKAINE